MKTERRHELQTNDLAARLAKVIERARPYTNQIVWGLIAVLVVIVGFFYFSSTSRQWREEAWDAYYQAQHTEIAPDTDPLKMVEERRESLRAVAEEYSGSTMGEFAKLAAADVAMTRGVQQYTVDKENAQKLIGIAQNDYRALIGEAENRTVRNQATFNLGISAEMLGDIESAVKHYNNVRGTLEGYAKERAAQLEAKPVIDDFYAWYNEARPKAPPVTSTDPGTPGKKPDFDVQAPLFDLDQPDSPIQALPGGIDDLNLPGPEVGPAEKPGLPEKGTAPEPALPKLPATGEEGKASEPSAAEKAQEPPPAAGKSAEKPAVEPGEKSASSSGTKREGAAEPKEKPAATPSAGAKAPAKKPSAAASE